MKSLPLIVPDGCTLSLAELADQAGTCRAPASRRSRLVTRSEDELRVSFATGCRSRASSTRWSRPSRAAARSSRSSTTTRRGCCGSGRTTRRAARSSGGWRSSSGRVDERGQRQRVEADGEGLQVRPGGALVPGLRRLRDPERRPVVHARARAEAREHRLRLRDRLRRALPVLHADLRDALDPRPRAGDRDRA